MAVIELTAEQTARLPKEGPVEFATTDGRKVSGSLVAAPAGDEPAFTAGGEPVPAWAVRQAVERDEAHRRGEGGETLTTAEVFKRLGWS